MPPFFFPVQLEQCCERYGRRAERVSASGPRRRPIANQAAAEHYGLAVMVRASKTTRAISRALWWSVASRSRNAKWPRRRLLLGAQRARSLFAILQVFAENQINMIKLESRPIPASLEIHVLHRSGG